MSEFACQKCEKSFGSHESLRQHEQAKHGMHKFLVMPRKAKKYAVIAVVIVAVLVLGWWIRGVMNSPGEHDGFAKCLAEKGVKFYGAFWCPHCNEQKKLFGKSAKYLDYVECSTPDRRGQTPVCIGKDIGSYPTWEFPDGSRKTGLVSLEELGSKSGCVLG